MFTSQMFSHPSQVHPSLFSEKYQAAHPVHHGGRYHPQSFRVHEIVGSHHPEILRPESAPLLARRPQHIAHEMNEQRCVSGSPSLLFSQSQSIIHYIPPETDLPYRLAAPTPHQSTRELGLPHQSTMPHPAASPEACGWTMAGSLSPVLTASSDALPHSEENLSWNEHDAEQYFHLAEGELSGGSTCGHSVDLSVSAASFGVDSTSPDTAVSIPRSRPQSPPQVLSLQNSSQPVSDLSRSRYTIEEMTRSQVIVAGRRCRPSQRVSKAVHPDPETLKDLVDRKLVATWAKKEQDSRTLQKLMRAASERNQQSAWNQIEDEGVELSCHVFGNYVVQKFLEFGSAALRKRIVSCLKRELRHMAQDNFGCRVVQKAIEVSDLSDKKILLRCLSPDLPVLVGCQHGNHVVQKFVTELPADQLDAIYKVFDGRVVGHCFQMYGCRVVQRLYVHSTSEFKDRMTRDILDHCLRLARDQWGNYVIQFIIENGPKSVVKQIIDMLLEDFEALSFDKLASNVVEKSVEFASSSALDAFVKCLLTRSNDELLTFLTHDYGNYVVQTIVDRANFKHGAHKIHRRLKKYGLAQEVKMTTAGRRVISKLDEKMQEYQNNRRRGEQLNSRRH